MSVLESWENLAEPENPLLPRARTIAGNGGVSIEIDGNVVRGQVHRGGQASVCHVEIAAADDVDTLTPVLESSDCSCSARNGMCLHVLATIVSLAHQVERDPHLATRLCAPPTDTDDGEVSPWTPVRELDPRSFFDLPR